MKEKLLKQTVFCGLIVLALIIAGNSDLKTMQDGKETVMKWLSADYTAEEIMKAVKAGGRAVSTVPAKMDNAVAYVTGKPVYGEPIDEKSGPERASVYSVGGGQVTAVGENEEIGKYIKIKHGSDGESLYGNLSKVFVEVPQRVKRGQIIGVYDKTNEKDFYYSFKEFN